VQCEKRACEVNYSLEDRIETIDETWSSTRQPNASLDLSQLGVTSPVAVPRMGLNPSVDERENDGDKHGYGRDDRHGRDVV
jgi:hypothetical protein